MDEDGRILLGGATLAAGYLGRPGAHRDGVLEEDGVRWYRTNDLGALDADGKLTVLGRADDVVITGGVKVSAAHVQAELEKLDGVRGGLCRRRPVRRVGPGPGRLRGAWPTAPRQGIAGFTAGGTAWAPALGALAPKTVLAAGELLMLPNGKPDRLAMTVRLTRCIRENRQAAPAASRSTGLRTTCNQPTRY